MKDAPFRFQVRAVRTPGWLVPLMVVLGLAMIPVALALALGVLALALGVGFVRSLLPGSGSSLDKKTTTGEPRLRRGAGDGVIDAEYEAKDSDEKG